MPGIKEMPYWKWALLLVAALLLAALLYGVSSAIELFPEGWPHNLAAVVVAAAMLWLYAWFTKLLEKEPCKDLPLKKAAGHLGLGLLTALLYFCIVAGVMALCGCYRITGIGHDWKGIFNSFFLFLIVAIGEEILFRGVLYRWIREKTGYVTALVVSSLIFGFVHITNPNGTLWSSVAIAIEAGLLLGAAYEWSGTLWLPIGIHWAWNFSQGNVFGFAVSGQEAGASLLLSQVEGPAWITGGDFGAEASVVATLAGAALSAWFIWQISRRK